MDWENGPTRAIKTEADLARRFDFYFTTDIKEGDRDEKTRAHIDDR